MTDDHVDRLFRAALELSGDREEASALVLETYAKVGAQSAGDLPGLLRVLEQQHRRRSGETLALAGEGDPDVSAPLALREALQRQQAERRPYPGRLHLAAIGLTLMIIATMAAFLAPGGPTVEAVAAAAQQGPENDPSAPAYAGLLGDFTSTGTRTDTVDGRSTTTVIFGRGDETVTQTEVDGDPLDLPDSKRVKAGPLSLASRRDGDVSIVAWHADGKTYVLASEELGTDALIALLRES